MSCQACEDAQESADRGGPHQVAYVRVGNGNVRITGCPEHIEQLIEQLRQGKE